MQPSAVHVAFPVAIAGSIGNSPTNLNVVVPDNDTDLVDASLFDSSGPVDGASPYDLVAQIASSNEVVPIPVSLVSSIKPPTSTSITHVASTSIAILW
ncbi:hypothetical protein V6N11_069796 [Hibiscus sabdariffa]|uniref:Uncharacterized protein n=1 Tax=Hibiscus sabdariffa TaxID=183260 RepID=A0ABR2Q482_9ROSI